MNHARRRAAARRAVIAVCLTTALSACGRDNPAGSDVVPVIVKQSIVPSANVLSARVFLQVQFAESVVVRYGPAGSPLDSLTAAVRVHADTATVPILGLVAGRRYEFLPVLYGARNVVAAATDSFTTGDLPVDLPSFRASGTDPSPGFVVFATDRYGLVIDNTGRVVWYRRFEHGTGLSFMPTAAGTFAAKPVTPSPGDVEPWIEIDIHGRELRPMSCVGGLSPRLHDIIVQTDGSYWVMCDDVRTMDLRNHGGDASARVTGTSVQHVSDSGILLFQWTPFDHFDIADLEPQLKSGPNVNWTHGNAIVLDVDGNLIVSFRNLSEVTKLDTRTGNVLWRLGGVRNQFSFAPATSLAFFRQHGVRVGAPGELLLLDNLGEVTSSRVERYSLSMASHTASLVQVANPLQPLVGSLGGSVQRLARDRMLVSYGNGAHVVEYDGSGSIVWRIEGDPGYVFRAERIRSLYRPDLR